MAEVIYAGDGGLFKTCALCRALKPIFCFGFYKSGPLGRNTACKPCAAARTAEWRSENRDAAMASSRKSREKAREKLASDPELAAAEAIKQRDNSREFRAKNPDLARSYARKWREENSEYEASRSKKKRLANPDAYAQYSKEWRARNPEKAKLVQRESSRRKRSTPKGIIENSMRGGIKRGLLKGAKQGRSTFDILGYSPEELKTHLERQFERGMTWDNYGRGGWEIDHRIPLAAFAYETPDDAGFKAAWAITNLQPLWSSDNYKKHKKILYLV